MSLSSMLLSLAALAILLVLVPVPVPVHSLTVHLVPHTHDDVGWLLTVVTAERNTNRAGADQYYVQQVQYILDTVMVELSRNPQRKFIYVEQAFFQRWWRQQSADMQTLVRTLVNNKQLEFVNGGWSMHDEGCTHYIDMIDQTTLGHNYIATEFGTQALPTVGWQIDPFGHSNTQAALLSAEVGFDGLFFFRIDQEDKYDRLAHHNLEFIWQGSPSLGNTAQVFTGVFQQGYWAPSGFCWDGVSCNDNNIQQDKRIHDYNLDSIVEQFKHTAWQQAGGTIGQLDTMNIMWTMGSDFQYQNAHHWFINLDRLIAAVNADGNMTAMYSTPSLYVAAKQAEHNTYSIKTDDFFPYADSGHSQMVGYLTSRPALKRYVRIMSNLLQVARQIEVVSHGNGSVTQPLWESESVVQHHDGVSGSSKQHVAYDYALRLATDAATADALIENTIATLTTITQAPNPFSSCPLINISRCTAAEVNTNLVLVIWNTLAHSRRELITIPVPNHSMYVLNATALGVQHAVLPTYNNAARDLNGMPYMIQFLADLPPLGFTTYFLLTSFDTDENHVEDITEDPTLDAQQQPLLPLHHLSSSAAHKHIRKLVAPRRTVPAAAPPTTIENEYWLLQFNSSGWLVTATNKTSGEVWPFATELLYYESYFDNDQSMSSGAYIFRPQQQYAHSLSNGTIALNIVSAVANTDPNTGNATAEARQTFNSWGTLTTRLLQGDSTIWIEYSVGPIPVCGNGDCVHFVPLGREVILRYTTNIASNRTWYTDANGREMQKRVRNERASFRYVVYENVSSNYYPCNALLVLQDMTHSLSVLPDRSHGSSSIMDGTVELMLHRRLAHDDHYGVGEALNETETLSDGTTRGLVVTGKHQVLLTPTSTAYAQARSLQARVYAEPYVSFSQLTGSAQRYHTMYIMNRTYVQQSLPPNVDLITMQPWRNDLVLIRLSHLFGVNEDAVLSQPVMVDLATVFVWPIVSITQVSLTAQAPANTHHPLAWKTPQTPQKTTHTPKRGGLSGTVVTIGPGEVLTFTVEFQRG